MQYSTCEMILELKLERTWKGVAYKCLTEEVFDEGVEVRTLTTGATPKAENMDEMTGAEDLTHHGTAATVRGASEQRSRPTTEGPDQDTNDLGSSTCDER